MKIKRVLLYIISAVFILAIGVLIGCEQSERVSSITYSVSGFGTIVTTDGTVYEKEFTVDGANFDKNDISVTAVPLSGYYFKSWSDGVTDSTRTDVLTGDDKAIKAEFAKIDDPVKLTYKAGVWGSVVGECKQTVQRGKSGEPVTAVPDETKGTLFMRWSDGLTEATRCDIDIANDITVTAEFGFSVEYRAGENGSIVGGANQIVAYGKPITATAVPDKGYAFIMWSDGVTTAERTDSIYNNLSVTALFAYRDPDYFTYHYDCAVRNNIYDKAVIGRIIAANNKLSTPEREHFDFDGWFLDKQFTKRVSDSDGNIVIGNEIFDEPTRDLYAKWILSESDVVKHKILLVFVSELNIKYEANIDYEKMTVDEKKAAMDFAVRFEKILNGLTDGLIEFSVEAIFTSRPIYGMGYDEAIDRYVMSAHAFPEYAESKVFDGFKSVMTVFSRGKKNMIMDCDLTWNNGKFATVELDDMDRFLAVQEASDEQKRILKRMSDTFADSVAEMIGAEVGATSFAYVCRADDEFKNSYPDVFADNLSRVKHYLLNAFPVYADRKTEYAGIPYEYWLE